MKLVYVASGNNPRAASVRMAADTVKLWEKNGFQAEMATMSNIPEDGDAYVFCKCIPSKRPRDGALVAFHMHDFWDDDSKSIVGTLKLLKDAPIDVLVPCSEPYEAKIALLIREIGIAARVSWCPESPVWDAPPVPNIPPADGPFRIGFHGTGSSFRFLSGEPARGIERVAKRFPVELVVLSNFPRQITEDALKDTLRLRSARVRYVPWTQESHSSEIASWDVAVLPASHDSEYAFIKSCNRLREAVARSVPVVAQKGNPDMEWFSEGGTVCPLAGNSEEWFLNTKHLLRYRRTRQSYNSRSRKRLMSIYSAEAVIKRWKTVFMEG